MSPLMSLILRQYPLAVLSVCRSPMASSCTSCLFFWRCPFLLMRFVILPSRLRTCAQPLSVGVWHLEAACFVMGSVSPRLNGTDVFVCRSTSYCRVYHESGACLQKRSFAVYVVRGKGAQVFSRFCFVFEKFNRNCHRRHFDLCCGVCFFRHERQVLLLSCCDKFVLTIRCGQAAVRN